MTRRKKEKSARVGPQTLFWTKRGVLNAVMIGIASVALAVLAIVVPAVQESRRQYAERQPALDVSAAFRHGRTAFELRNVGKGAALSIAVLCVHRKVNAEWPTLKKSKRRDFGSETRQLLAGGSPAYLFPSLCYPEIFPRDESIGEVYIYVSYYTDDGQLRVVDWDFARYPDRPGWWSGNVTSARSKYSGQFKDFDREINSLL